MLISLYYCNSSSIAKTLLLQMPMVTFTQFHNELARVLGMCQCKDKPKSVITNQVEADLGETEYVSKSQNQMQCQNQCSIFPNQNLHSKLDACSGGKLTNA